ncbi:MAG: response regulator, partial [Pirellula sp.]
MNNTPTPRILIADDNSANRELLEALLANIECDTEIAVDGQDTLDKVKSFKPDLILLDVMMPKKNGFEVCRTVKGDPTTSRIMVLMVTALSELCDGERA